MEGDVHGSEIDCHAGALGDPLAQPPRERDAARVDADESESCEVGVVLDQLVGDPGQRALESARVEQDCRCPRARDVCHACAPFRPR